MIETSVVEWSRQVEVFLNADSSKSIRDGMNPGPMTEIDFWKSRFSILSDIHTQVIILFYFKLYKILIFLTLEKKLYCSIQKFDFFQKVIFTPEKKLHYK